MYKGYTAILECLAAPSDTISITAGVWGGGVGGTADPIVATRGLPLFGMRRNQSSRCGFTCESNGLPPIGVLVAVEVFSDMGSSGIALTAVGCPTLWR